MAIPVNPFVSKKQNEQEQSNITPTPGSQQSALISGTSTPSPQSPSTPRATTSGSYNNLLNYINANKNTNMGQQIVNKYGTEADTLNKDIGKAETETKSAASTAMSPLSGAKDVLDKLATDPSSFLGDTSSAEKIRDFQYSGPQQLQGYEGFSGRASGIQGAARNTTTESGRNSLLQQTFAKPTYSQGQQKLDQLLLQTNPDQTRKLNTLRSIASGVGNTLNTAQSGITGLAQTNQAEVQKDKADLQTAVAKGLTGLDTSLTGKVSSLPVFQPDSDWFAAVGKAYTPENIAKVRDAMKNPGLSNVVSDKDIATIKALQKIGGSGLSTEMQDIVNKYSNLTPEKFDPLKGFDVSSLANNPPPQVVSPPPGSPREGGSTANSGGNLGADPTMGGSYTMGQNGNPVVTSPLEAPNNVPTELAGWLSPGLHTTEEIAAAQGQKQEYETKKSNWMDTSRQLEQVINGVKGDSLEQKAANAVKWAQPGTDVYDLLKDYYTQWAAINPNVQVPMQLVQSDVQSGGGIRGGIIASRR